MKQVVKSVFVTVLLSFCVTNVSAQKFLKKISKALDKTETALGIDSKDKDQQQAEQAAEESDTTKAMKPEDFLSTSPSYSVKKVFAVDDKGERVKNEDGTEQYSYYIIDKDGKVADLKTARKHVHAAWKAGLIILGKIGGGAAAGGLVGKGLAGSKKGALIGAGVGAAVGLAASGKDIKKIRTEMKQYKQYNKLIDAYEKTFSEEGQPLQADVDLSDVDGINFNDCEEISKSSADVAQEIKNSQSEGENLTLDDDIDFDVEIG